MEGGGTGRGDEHAEADGVHGAQHAGDVKTPFTTTEDLASMKAMVADTKPALVLEVADEWENVADRLVSGGGSIKGDFDRIVEHALQHWEGEAADAFAEFAAGISRQLGDCATYARRTSVAMRNAGERLSEIKPKIEAIGQRRRFSHVVNGIANAFTRGGRGLDPGFRGDLGERKPEGGDVGARPAGKDDESEAVRLMVDLALTYNSQTQAMSSWQRKLPPGRGGDGGEYPGEPGGLVPVPGPMRPVGTVRVRASVDATPAGGSGKTGGSVPDPHSSRTGKTAGAATRLDGVTGGTASPVAGAQGSANGAAVNVAGRGAGGSAPAGLGAQLPGRGAARPTGHGLHSSRGGAWSGERGRDGGRVLGVPFGGDVRGGGPGRYSRGSQDGTSGEESPGSPVEDDKS